MADDNNQRPYRSSETRATPQAAPASGNDPLAELARLIGQSDPFAEFGRDGARRVAPAAPAASPADWSPQPVNYPAPPADPRAPPTQPDPFGAQNFDQPRYGAASFASGAGLYRTEADAAYAAAPGQEGHAGGAYYSGEQHDVEDDDFYDDAPPPRRRLGIVAIAAVFGLAVIGTAGAIGYRALFGSSGSGMPPPVIKADTTPSKIIPSTPGKDAQSNKLITDRVGDGSRNEKLVSREEQPIQQPSGMAMAPGPDVQASAPLMPANGSGIVAAEPKKIHTIVIHPDQAAAADVATAASPPPARAELPVAPPPPVKPAAPRVASMPPPEPKSAPAAAPPEPRPAVSRAAPPAAATPPAHRVVAANNAPLSLNPGDTGPAAVSAPAVRAVLAAPARVAPQPASGGGYAVQVSSQRSEADAAAAFKTMQAKYPGQLGGRSPIIHRVDLGAKGIYFRAMVGPFASSSEASNLCSSLKSAGGQCLVQKI